jgi:hypothetical protein
MATNNHRDDAIVARLTDTNRDKPVVAVAGIGRGGTRIAGAFLTGANDLVQLNRASQNAEDKKNVEVVLSTQMIAVEPGPPSPGSTGQLNFQVAKTEGHESFQLDHAVDGPQTIEACAEGFVRQTYKEGVGPVDLFRRINSSTRLRGVDIQLCRARVATKADVRYVRISLGLAILQTNVRW